MMQRTQAEFQQKQQWERSPHLSCLCNTLVFTARPKSDFKEALLTSTSNTKQFLLCAHPLPWLRTCLLCAHFSTAQSFKSPQHLPVFSRWRILHWHQEEGAVPKSKDVFGSLNSSWTHLKTSCQLWTALYFFTMLKLSTGTCHNSPQWTVPANNNISFLIFK